MAPPKKMSLQEFFSDESYGGSWADDEFDISSISVPIEKNKGYGYGASTSKYGSGFGAGRSAYLDNGPPYIVKLSNIPVTSNDAFINDLFHSRFTPLVKFKILFDPLSLPLDLGLIKKVAFVELPSFESQNKVAKWQDVEYRGSRRVVIEVADFNDFQQNMRFNQENHQELLRAEQAFFASGPRHAMDHSGHSGSGSFGHGGRPTGRAPGGMPLDQIQIPGQRNHMAPQMRSRHFPGGDTQHQDTANHMHASSRAHTNPFGNAKPINVLDRQREIESNSHNTKHTSGRATWAEGNTHKAPFSRGDAGGGVWSHDKASSLPKMSLADILTNSKAKDHTKNPRAASSNSTPKPVARKPTVLMKKSTVSTPEPQVNAGAPFIPEAVPKSELEQNLKEEATVLKEQQASQPESVESIEKNLALISIEPQSQEKSQTQSSTDANDRKTPEESRNGKEVSANKQDKTERKESITKTDTSEASSETRHKPEQKTSERRRRITETDSGARRAKVDSDGMPHGPSERRPRRPSNRNRDKPARPLSQGRDLNEIGQDSGSLTRQAGEEKNQGDSQKPRREQRPRRQQRRQLTDRAQENSGQRSEGQAQEKPYISKKPTSAPSEPASGTSPAGSVAGNDAAKSEDHGSTGRGRRGRGRGNGRGGARTDKSDGTANEEPRRSGGGRRGRGRGRDVGNREGGPVREQAGPRDAN